MAIRVTDLQKSRGQLRFRLNFHCNSDVTFEIFFQGNFEINFDPTSANPVREKVVTDKYEGSLPLPFFIIPIFER